MGAWAGWGPAGLRWTDSSLWRTFLGRVLRRCRFSTCAAAIGVSFLLVVCLFYLAEEPKQEVHEPALPEEEIPVTLLIWTYPFDEYRELPDCLELYQVGGCTLTDDRSAYPRADAVLIHHREVAVGDADLPPEPRPGAQKWIWMNYESPSNTYELWYFEGVFNLTMSYRMDSDIFLPYGYLVPQARANALSKPSRSTRPRDQFIAWVISNWSAAHARIAFYQKLRRFVRIDVFGGAGRPLPKGDGQVVRLLERYMFYLALENSQHTDYITEKLWNAVMAGAVPVVLGPSRRNYERFLPREAFIHVDDFPSVKELAQYLLRLRRDPIRMRRHLDWRRGYSLHQPKFWDEHYCTACRVVRRTRGQSNAVKHLTRWFFS